MNASKYGSRINKNFRNNQDKQYNEELRCKRNEFNLQHNSSNTYFESIERKTASKSGNRIGTNFKNDKYKQYTELKCERNDFNLQSKSCNNYFESNGSSNTNIMPSNFYDSINTNTGIKYGHIIYDKPLYPKTENN